MKQKLTLTVLLFLAIIVVRAQDSTYNRFSIDAQFGFNNPISPMSPGYDAPTFGLFHTGLGFRYMFNPKFGLRLSGNYDRFHGADGSYSFETDYYRTTLEGVVNLGKVLDFDQWTKHFGILLHTGMGYAAMNGRNSSLGSINMINVVGGITPQFKLGERWSLYADVSAIAHVYQAYSYDYTRKQSNRGIDGYLYNFSVGLQYNFGKHRQHADWVSLPGLNNERIAELRERVKTLENQQKDDDEDGVANYLDQEPGTYPGAVVDTKGRTVVPEVRDDGSSRVPENGTNTVEPLGYGSMNTASVNMIESSEVKFETDQYNIDASFMRMLDGIVAVMNQNGYNLTIIGHADDRGTTAYNQELSEKRASAVKDYLVSKGIDTNRLTTKGVGETQPKSASRSVEARAENRRVQFDIH